MIRIPRGVVLAATTAAVMAVPATAAAQFAATPAGAALAVSSASLAAPTSVGASKHCGLFGLFGASLTVTWTATTSTPVSGYVVTATPSDGSAATTVSVSGASTTQATLGVTPRGTYTASVAAVAGSWTSPAGAASAIKINCGSLG